jgi:hypothetical protein
LVALSDYNAFGTLGRFGFFTGRFIKGQFARLSHAVLYRRYQLALHGTARAALLWAAERINALVQPKIRMTQLPPTVVLVANRVLVTWNASLTPGRDVRLWIIPVQ